MNKPPSASPISSKSGRVTPSWMAFFSAVAAPSGTPISYAYTTTNTSDQTAVAIPVDDTIPQNTEGKEFTALNTTINAHYADSILRVVVHVPMVDTSNILGGVTLALFRDSGADAVQVASVSFSAVGDFRSLAMVYHCESGAAGETTFKLRFGPSNELYTASINRANAGDLFSTANVASMEITEIKA